VQLVEKFVEQLVALEVAAERLATRRAIPAGMRQDLAGWRSDRSRGAAPNKKSQHNLTQGL
jgi:hypothetical protein